MKRMWRMEDVEDFTACAAQPPTTDCLLCVLQQGADGGCVQTLELLHERQEAVR